METLVPEGFKLQYTADGSPTLAHSGGEWMHNRMGAVSETVYIYGEAFTVSQKAVAKPVCLSVGMGLGYVEWVVAAMTLKNESEIGGLWSFESEASFRQGMQDYLDKGGRSLFRQSRDAVAGRLGVDPKAMEERLLQWRESGLWQICGTLDLFTTQIPKFNVCFFDAFSAETSPDLWSEEILRYILGFAALQCVFSSYSSKGSVKRILEENHFELHPREGFGGKRECTLAVRSGRREI